jgi:putative endonuclease
VVAGSIPIVIGSWAHEQRGAVFSVLLFFMLMKPLCYILFSNKLNRFYTGVCQGNLEERIHKHNNHSYGRHRFTASVNDWELFLAIEVKDFSHAVRIERHIKSMKSSSYIRNLKKYPELLDKVIKKTST